MIGKQTAVIFVSGVNHVYPTSGESWLVCKSCRSPEKVMLDPTAMLLGVCRAREGVKQ